MARSILLLKALEAAREAAAIIHRHYQAQLDVRIKADAEDDNVVVRVTPP